MKKYSFLLLFIFTIFTVSLFSQDNALQGGADVAFRNGEYARAAEICRNELKADIRNFNSWFFLTRALLQSGQYNLAKSECKRALQYFPTNAALHEILGAASFYLNEYDEALSALTFGVQNGPDSTFRRTVTWNQIATIYLANKQYNLAVAAYSEAIRLNPTNYAWLERSAFANYKAGLVSEALKQYKRIVDAPSASALLKDIANSQIKELSNQGASSNSTSAVTNATGNSAA